MRLLREHAVALREAGVSHIKMDGIEVDLLPLQAEEPEVIEEEFGDPDPMNDPRTFGGRMPRISRRPPASHEDN